jgi:hypothetical protein
VRGEQGLKLPLFPRFFSFRFSLLRLSDSMWKILGLMSVLDEERKKDRIFFLQAALREAVHITRYEYQMFTALHHIMVSLAIRLSGLKDQARAIQDYRH